MYVPGRECCAFDGLLSGARQVFVAAKAAGRWFPLEGLGDELIRALAQCSMYPLIFLAVLLHERRSC